MKRWILAFAIALISSVVFFNAQSLPELSNGISFTPVSIVDLKKPEINPSESETAVSMSDKQSFQYISQSKTEHISVPVEICSTEKLSALPSTETIDDAPLYTIDELNVITHASTQSVKSDPYELQLNNVTIDQSSKKVIVSATVDNNTSADTNAVLYAAIYDQNDALLHYSFASVDLSSNSAIQKDVVINYALADVNHTLKLLLWDNSMHPLCSVLESDLDYGITATSITLTANKRELNLYTDDTAVILHSIKPYAVSTQPVTYQSSDTSVATVSSDGVVTPKKAGTVTITVTTSDGGAFNTITFTVFAGATSITLNQTKINIWEGNTYQLKTTPSPATNSSPVYSSSNNSVATINTSGKITAHKKGTSTITVVCDNAVSQCTVNVYLEADYISQVAAEYESNGNPGEISSGYGDYGGASYGVFQLSSQSNGPKSFYNWLISSGRNVSIGNTLKSAHQADGGKDYTFGTNFNNAWKNIASTQYDEFYSCQMGYAKTEYYDYVATTVKSLTGLDVNHYGIALKNAFFARAIQQGPYGAVNRITSALGTFKNGWANATEKQIIAAIYAECGATTSVAPDPDSIKMNSSSSIAVKYGLVGKYMKYYSLNSSSIQASVWLRLNINEPNSLYELIDNPPVIITPQT